MKFWRRKTKPANLQRKRVEFHGQEFTIVELTVLELEGFRSYAQSEAFVESLAMCKVISDGVEEFLHQKPDQIMDKIGAGCMQFLMNQVLELSASLESSIEEEEKNS